LVIRVAPTSDERRIAQTARGLVERAASGSRGGNVAVFIECDCANCIVRNGGREEISFGVCTPGLKLPQALDLAWNDQIFIAA